MLSIVRSTRFEKDVKLARRRGLDLNKLEAALLLLATAVELPERLHDHALTGDWNGYRDLHLAPDWLLIYKVTDDTLYLARTGSHSDLF